MLHYHSLNSIGCYSECPLWKERKFFVCLGKEFLIMIKMAFTYVFLILYGGSFLSQYLNSMFILFFNTSKVQLFKIMWVNLLLTSSEILKKQCTSVNVIYLKIYAVVSFYFGHLFIYLALGKMRKIKFHTKMLFYGCCVKIYPCRIK